MCKKAFRGLVVDPGDGVAPWGLWWPLPSITGADLPNIVGPGKDQGPTFEGFY